MPSHGVQKPTPHTSLRANVPTATNAIVTVGEVKPPNNSSVVVVVVVFTVVKSQTVARLNLTVYNFLGNPEVVLALYRVTHMETLKSK